ncbi:Cytochrome C biogenesis protein transmembrane region [Ferrimonas sediminum]|uniref:Cytochrome C biogenesis protein transmembrane region n=1 Tax=Ferrimonas sediminum TaxID=718193 RepID=A0A1G8KLY3_9GAMM|nr:aromatic aminobenezylarsenical efflux permease ArsG family transporter [Ferrimonas sediminum]SDI44424.1 Cytochrome C biogenesis protein transmembrane region [Ferrimonas sediminum]
MMALSVAALSALWLGVLTSVSPCPLATNVAAVSYLSRQVASPRRAVYQGVAYGLGRTISYLALAALLLGGALSAPGLSQFLQSNMNMMLGPVLLVVGVVLLSWLRLPLPTLGLSQSLQQRLGQGGLPGALALGVLFALSFCPTSAALFFASLLPLAMAHQSVVVLPGMYGIGTALPVLAFALMVSLGTLQLAAIHQGIARAERVLRRLSGMLFLGAGLYYCWVYLIPLIG